MANRSIGDSANAGGSTQTGLVGGGSITGGGSPTIEFGNAPASSNEGSAGGGGGGYDSSADEAAQAAAQEAARNLAKAKAKDQAIAQEALKAQRERATLQAQSGNQPKAKQQQAKAEDKKEVQRSEEKQAHARRAPNGQLYNSETAEEIEEKPSSNNLARPTAVSEDVVSSFTGNAPRKAPKRGTVIASTGQMTPGPAIASQAKAQRQPAMPQPEVATQAAKSAPKPPSAPKANNLVSIIEEETTRQKADRVFRNYTQERKRDAERHNDEVSRIEDNYSQWVDQHPMANGSVVLPSYLTEIDEEAFGNEAEPLMKSNYRTLDEYEQGRESTGVDTEQKDTRKQDRWIDNLARDMKMGFFHITTERVSKDKETGDEMVRWSAPVEDAMSNVMEYFGLHGVEGQQTVFRLVRMYASMGVDSNGNMFNENADEWSLNEREFVTICNFIIRSCIEHGHPMAMPFKRWQLRGTDIYPSGVMPKAIAKAITGPDSNLQMSPADLVQMCQDEWTTHTYPTMKANLVNKKEGDNYMAQRVAIEKMQQAISRLDGISAEDFSRRYGVDTTLHYKLSEYEDQLAEYAMASNGNYDSDKVIAKKQERTEYYRRQAMKQKGVKFNNDGPYETIEIEGVKKQSGIQAGANLITAIAKTNSIISRPVLAIASLSEKAVGNLRTKFGIDILTAIENDGGKKYTVGDQYYERMKTDEAVKSLDAAKMLFEIGGPGAARLFKEEGLPCTHENVTRFLKDKYLKDTSAPKAAQAFEKLQRFSQKLMVGDLVFKKSDTMNWFNALLLSNASLGNVQDKLARNSLTDQSGSVSLTGNEIEDIMDAHADIAGFFTEMMGTDAGISAYNMMRANSIAQVNPVSYYTDRFLRDHGVTNMMITMFVDTFPTYGLNYLYNLVPFSRTLTYIGVKKTESNGTANAIGNADLTIGGNLNDSGIDINDPGFQAGLRMNLVFDAMTLGHNLLVGGMLGLAFLALGFEPPDDDENIFNVSMWKIGGKEIQWAWWLNDLSLLGMPFAYYIAAGHKTGDWQLAGQLMMDSLHDQVDGNVVLDFADMITNWRYDIMEFDQMSKDPSYTGPKDFTSFALAEMYSNLLRAGNKLTPGAPLFDSVSRSALIRGIDARSADPRHVYDKSDEWHKEHGVTKNVDSYFEFLDRKYSTGNWLYALSNNFLKNTLSANPEEKTGYFWWEMPVRTMGDPLAYVWAGEFTMDYNNKPEGMSDEQYNAEMANRVLDYIKQFQANGMSADRAVGDYGFMIPNKARKATLEYLYNDLKTLDNEWKARNESGELADKNAYQAAKVDYYNRRDEINTLIYDWLKNETIPEWGTEYEQLLTDYDITYVYKDSGKPAPMGAWLDQFDPNIEAVYKPKGNHPTSLLPWTEVDYSDNVTNRGYNAETTPYWWEEGMTGSDAEALRNLTLSNGKTLAEQEIPYGRDAGKKLGDVLFGMQNRGVYSNPDEPTIGWRSYVPKKTKLSDDIVNYGNDYQKPEITEQSSYPNMYPTRSYGQSYNGYSSSSNYNPKIYSTPRQVNSDRAATMYTKAPQSARTTYLRPGFSTKGSREAYKRQDI